MKRLKFLLTSVFLLGAALAAPTLVPAPCHLEPLSGLQEGEGYSCARLAVPIHHQHPEQGQYQLQVLRIQGKVAGGGTPTVFVNGGPGSNLQGYLYNLLQDGEGKPSWMEVFLEHGDIVLYDQRGSGQSEPNTRCSSIEATRCLQEAREKGLNLPSLNNWESVQDLFDLQQALGVPIHLYGASYGSYLAQQYLKYHPDTVKKAILEGVMPLDHNTHPANPQEVFDRYVAGVLALCAQQTRCAAHFPDLQKNWQNTLNELQERPLNLQFREVEFRVGPAELPMLFFYLGYLFPQHIPLYVSSLPTHHYTLLVELSGLMVEMHQQNSQFAMTWMMSAQLQCSLEGPAETCDTTPLLGEQLAVAPYPADFAAPLQTDLPILLISGTLDPVTPPAGALAVQKGLKNALHLQIEGGGHGSHPGPAAYACSLLVTRSFLEQGERADLSCIEKVPAFAFLTP